MRYSHFLLVLLGAFVVPIYGFAAASSGSASVSEDPMATLSQQSATNRSSLITTSPSDVRESAVRDANPRMEEQDQFMQAKGSVVKSSFQTYVETATGKSLDVFGRDLFLHVPTTFAPLKSVQVNGDYVIGQGDALQIRGWGMVDIDVNVTVSRSGEIFLPRIGSVKVAGVKYRDLQGYLKKAVGKMFTHFELSASLSQTRSVQIYVVGHAQRPGVYTLSAMSTLLNALFASGGPSVTGTMRTIQLKRGGEATFSFDLYDMLIRGDKSSDIALKDGDVLYIPSVGPLAALHGDVKKPAIFELKQRATIADMVQWAGGIESVAGKQALLIEKSVEGHYQTVAEIQADSSIIAQNLARLEVEPTSIVRVVAPGATPLEVKVERAFVHIDGEVRQSGVFELQKGETLKALIERLGGVTDDAYLFGTKLSRESVKREQQLKIDESVDRYEKDIEANAKQRLAGTNDPAQAALVAAEAESQRALLKKLRLIKSEGRIILNFRDFRAKVKDLPDFPLQDGDTVYIPKIASTVDVIGAVYQQNTFIYRPERHANDYLLLAGGVSGTGDTSEMYRICADGTIRSKRHSGSGGTVNPGDAIVVPEKIQRGATLIQNLKDITSILYQFGLGAAGLATLKKL